METQNGKDEHQADGSNSSQGSQSENQNTKGNSNNSFSNWASPETLIALIVGGLGGYWFGSQEKQKEIDKLKEELEKLKQEFRSEKRTTAKQEPEDLSSSEQSKKSPTKRRIVKMD